MLRFIKVLCPEVKFENIAVVELIHSVQIV